MLDCVSVESKNIYSHTVGYAYAFISSVTAYVFETCRKRLVARAQCFPPDQFIFSHPCQHLASNLPTTIPFTCRSRPLKAQFTGNTTKSIKPLLTAIYEAWTH